MRALVPICALSLVVLYGCATQSSPGFSSQPASPPPQATPDPARVYADLLGRTEDFPRVVRSPKEYEGKTIVLYGVRNGDLRPVEGRFSLPLATPDGKTVIAATERPGNGQFHLVVTDDFAREARERKMLPSGTRGAVFVECKVSAQTTGRVVHYPCDVVGLVVAGSENISDSLRRAKDQTLEYHHY